MADDRWATKAHARRAQRARGVRTDDAATEARPNPESSAPNPEPEGDHRTSDTEATVEKTVHHETVTPPPDDAAFPEDKVEDKYFAFEAPNFLLKDECVGLVSATFLRDYAGPIDIRQTLETIPDALFHGPLELGDERHEGSGALMPSDVPIALSYTWAPKPPF